MLLLLLGLLRRQGLDLLLGGGPARQHRGLVGGQRLVLDQPSAREAAAAYLDGRPGLSASVQTDDRRVLVSVSRDVPLAFLRLAGFERVRIEATAPAEVRVGVGRASR